MIFKSTLFTLCLGIHYAADIIIKTKNQKPRKPGLSQMVDFAARLSKQEKKPFLYYYYT
jgi:hypothetical protein